MKITGCVCKVEGEKVAVVAVQRAVLDHSVEADRYIEHLAPVFEGRTVVLMGQGEDDSVTWYGPPPLTEKLGQVALDQFPWQEMDVDL